MGRLSLALWSATLLACAGEGSRSEPVSAVDPSAALALEPVATGAAPARSASSTSSAAPAGPPSPAARALARTFSSEVAGELVARAPAPGAYAMSLDLSFDVFVTTELRIDEHRAGAIRLDLRADGSASACIGVRGVHVTEGQYHYEPPDKRKHAESSDSRLLALAGHWEDVDGVARVTFDRMAWSTCDVAKTEKQTAPYLVLRCTGVALTARLPADGLACEASEGDRTVLGLGTPMSAALLDKSVNAEEAPSGPHLLLGRPGLALSIEHRGGRGERPKLTLRAAPVTVDESRH